MSLKELQDNLILNLLHKPNNFNLDILHYNEGASVEERLDVHRQTIIENLVNSIEIIYPGIWKLLGRDCARGVALSYIHELKYLPKNGDMMNYGREFPQYLDNFSSTQDLSYIKDFATYEWYKSECYHAKFVEGISFEHLQSLSEEQLIAAKFTFNKSVRFFKSDYAIDDIQNVLDNPDTKIISQDEDKYFFIINQNYGRILTYRVSVELWSFLQEIYSGEKFGVVADKYADKSGVDLSKFLEFMVANHLVTKV